MKKSLSILFTCIFIGINAFAQEKVLTNIGNDNPNQAAFQFDSEVFDFGTIKQGESPSYEFKFKNTGSEPLIITKADGSCGCTVPDYPKQPIMKGEEAIIKVTFNSAGKLGVQDKTVTIASNAKQNPMVLRVKGTIEKSDAPDAPATGSKVK